MNRSQAIDAISDQTGIAKKDVAAILDAQDGLIVTTLKGAADFTLGKSGKIELVAKKARTARNPATGEEIDVPAKNVAKLKPSKDLLAAIA